MKLKHFILALVAMLSCFTFTANAQVAKVGNTEYATIDEAIANWTNNSTLTLLADVTLSKTIELSSTEYHILDLGTYTMTAASRKDAIQIVNNGRSSASYALDIKADATNPGGITASGKAVVKTTGKSGVKDRPIIRFYGGVFNGSNVVYHSGSNGTNCPQFWFYGGEFNGTVYANRALFQFYGGIFNGNIQISVDSSAYALVSGGKFKKLSNLYGSALNSDKFTIGSAKGNYNRGIYVDKDGYYVITSAPITEVSAKYPAVKKESYNSNNYFYYSAAAANGMFYEVASMATGSNVTVYEHAEVVEELDNNAAVKDFTPELPSEVVTFEVEAIDIEATTEATTKVTFNVEPKNASGQKVSNPTAAITFRLPVPAAWTGKANVYHEGTLLGAYTIKEESGAKYVEVSSSSFSEFSVEAIVPLFAGEGTEASPYLIDSADKLTALRNEVNGGEAFAGVYFKLTSDITLSGEWTAIGNGSRNGTGYTGNAFKGVFDGDNNTISGLIITSTTAADAAIGLFGVVDGGTVKNLNLTDVNINVTNSNLAGAAIGMMLNGATAEAITVSGAVVGNDGVGGIVGRVIIDGTIANCINNASVTSSYGGIGGIVGKAYYEDGANTATFATVTGCTNKGTVTAPMYVGGIAGLARANVTNCVNEGAVVGGTQTGGIVGQLMAAGTVSGNENKAKVSGKSHVGGIIGDYSQSGSYTYNNVTIANNVNRGELAATEQCAAILGCNNIDGFTAMTATGNQSHYYAEGLELFGNPEDMVIDATNKFIVPVAQVGAQTFYTFAEAAAAAQAGSEIKLLANIDGDITVPANVTLNGNGFAISGGILAEGDITFAGVTTAADFDAKVVNTAVNIPAGASLQLTGSNRLVIGHGATFNITGTIADAKAADKATLTPSLKIAAGASITGNGVTFNVNNAYIVANANTTSKNSNANGTLDFNINNSIWEQTGVLAFYVPTSGKDPVVNFELKNSVLTTTSHLVFSVTKGEIVFDNSLVNQGTSRQIENRSTMTIKNGAVVNGAVATSSNAKNPGTIIVEDATYAVTGEFSGSDLGTGTLVVKKDANVTMGKITKANIVIDATDMTAGELANFTANLSGLTGTLEVINNDKLEASIVGGKIVLAAKPVAKIGETPYTTLEAAFAAATEGQTINMLDDATPALASQRAITKAAVIDLGGKTMTLTEDDLYFGTTTFKNGTIVVDPSVKPSTAVFWMFANQTLTFDAVKVVATGVTGTYLIGLEGENSDLNLLNGSEILVENTTALDLDIICVNGTNTCDIKVENSKVNVTNLDGRVFFRGNYTVAGNSEINLEGITKAGFRIEADQTLTIKDNAVVNIVGEPRDGGIHMTDLSATYTKAETATVNATVNEPKVAKVGENTYRTLAQAVAAVEDGGTITLIANETFTKTNRTHNSGTWYDGLYYVGDKSFTINLGGFTISQDGAVNDYLLNFKNDGTKANEITLKNGTIDAGTTAFCAICTSSSQANQLTINTENINIINNISNGSTIKLRGGAVLNVNGGTKITGKNSYLGIECVASTVNIYDGAEIYMNGTTSYNGCLVGACGGGTVNVYGGYGKGVKGGFIAMTSGGTINVAGGEWIANTDGTVGNNSNLYVLTAQSNKYESGFVGASIINVTGGTLRGGMDAWVLNNIEGEKAELNITGGNFNANPTRFVEEGYVAVENNGVWNVVKAAAKIGTTGYATLAEAVKAVKEGETIIILAGTYSEGTIKLPATLKNVTIKGESVARSTEGAVLKDMTISAADGNAYSYVGLTFDGITFDNSRILLTGWRNGDETIKNLTVTNCTFKNLNDNTNSAPVHINKDAAEAVNGFTFTNNVIDGATGGSKSGIYAQVTGEVKVENNIINNVSFRPYVIQVTTDDGIADNFTVKGNTFSGSAVGRAQGLGNNAEGTDNVNLVISNNIFKGITESQQICYWNFNPETTTADLSKNYYDIDIVANPSKIYFNSAAADNFALRDMNVFPIYTALNENGTINTESAFTPKFYIAKVGENSYETLSEAFAAVTDDTQTVVVLRDVTENLTGAYLRGNITTENGAKVTINLTNSDWVACPYTFVIGENVTLKVPALFYYAGGSQINGTVIADAYYQRYGGTKLTINEPGSMTVTSETCIIRYMDGDPNAGIYVVGDNNDETIGLNLSVAYFYQGMINAKDANIVAGTYWQTNETDGQGSANLVLDNSKLVVSVYDHPAKATGNSTVTLTNGSVIDAKNGGFTYGDNTALSVDATSKIIGKNGVDVKLPVATINGKNYTSLQAAIDAVQNGETIILQKDCAEVVSVNKSNVAFTIDGQNKAYTGKIQIAIGQNVTVKNVAFAHTGDESHDFIANVGSPTGKNYNTTLLVEACSFTGNGKGTDVAVRTIHPTAVTIKGCTASGLHSFLQNTGGQTVAIENVTLTESKGGLAIGSPNGAVSVKGCNLTTSTYGVRLDANNTNAPGATLENNTVNAYIPVSVRKATVENYVVTVEGDKNNYTATNSDGVWFAACTTEYEDGVALNEPTGKVKVTLNDTGLDAAGIYGSYYDALTIHVGATQNSRMVTRDIYVATMDEAVAEAKAINAGAVIYKVYGEVELTTGGSHGILDLGKNVVIEGADATAKLTIVGGGVPDIKGVTFKNIILADEGTYLPTANEFMYQNYIDCTFENVTFVDGIRLSGTSSIKDSKVDANTTNEYAIWLDEGEFTMTGTTVVGGADAYGLVKSDKVSKITITGNTFQYLGEANKEALNVKEAVVIAENNQFIDCVKGILPADKTNYTDESKTTVATDAAIAGNNTVTVYYAAVGEQKFETLLAAINAVQEGQAIELIRDVTMDYNARDAYETQAQNVVINGNGKTLTLNQKNSDWASFGLANNSKLVLNNMTIEKTGYGDTSGAWNTHAIIFSCPVEMNNVTVNNSVAVQAGAALTDVTINEANGYYGLWINGNGQAVTVNGGAINATNGGRGIKIADQYIDAPAQVTLNVNGTVFNTAKKAAVLVSSTAGAKITAANVNIANVAEDSENFVWVDEDWAQHFGNVEVTGATVRAESAAAFTAAITANGAVQAYYKTLAEAINAAQAGATVELLADVTLAGGYADATEGLRIEKEITLNGNGHTINCGNFQKGIRVYNPSNVSDFNVNFNNVKVVNNVANGRCIDTRSGNINLKVNSSTLIATNGNSQPLTIGGNDPVHRVTLNETTIDAGTSGYAVISFVSTNVDIQGVNNSAISGFAAFYLKGDAKTTNLNLGQGVYTGTNNHAVESGLFGTVVLEGDNNVVNLMGTNATVKAVANNTAPQAAFLVCGANNTIKVTKESAKIITEGNAYEAMVKADNAATTKFVDMGIERKLVAENRGYQFYSFEEAVRFAGNEGTIKVVNDFELAEAWTVAAGQNITLDLNGKTISQTKECTASYEMICNKGNLTITDSSDAKDGKLSFKDTSAGDPSFGWGSYTVRNEGNLVVENGTIEHLGEQDAHCIMAIFQYCGSTTINGGTISTPNYRSARLWKGEMTINGGTFDGQLWVQAVDNTAKLTVNGGTFEPNGGDASAVFVTNSTYDVDFAVTGGTFNGKVGCSDATKLANAITGGKFNAAAVAGTNKDLIAFGYEFGAADADGYQAVYNDESVLYIETLADLKAFRDAVNSGANYYAGVNVVLAADIDMAGENWVGIGSATKDHGFMGNFDGNGKTIKNLTITNPALDADGYAYAGLFAVTEGTDKDHQNTIKNLTIENVTITTTGHIAAAAIAYPYYTIVDNVKVCGDIKLQGGDYTAGVLAYTRRCVNASNLAIVGNTGSFVKGNQVVGGVISDIQMNGGLTAVYNNFSAEGLTVTGTKNVGGISGIIATQTLDGATVKNVALECGNASAGSVSGALGGTSTISNVTVENVTGATAILGVTYDGNAIEAKIGDTYYATLEAAYKAAQAGATVKLLAPVVIASGETLTLDKDVTVVYTSNVAGEDMFTNRGTLNISAGTITYANTDATGSNVTVSTISSEPGSVLNITGGTVENKTVKADGSSIYSFAIDMLTNGNLGDVTATIAGGTVYSDYMAIRQFNNGTACKNSLTINGGHIYGAKRAVQVHMDNNAAVTAINGGKIEAGEGGYALCNFAATGNLEVTGGEFIGAVYSARENFISGGIYDAEVYAGYCAEGYMPNKNVDGTYGVVLVANAYASIDGVTYGSLKAAVAAAKAGETITLLQDVKENVTISKHLTIDGAGKTIIGMITTDGKSLKVTIKNVNFDGNNKTVNYAMRADDDLNLVVENCSVKDYLYGFLYANKSNDKIVVKNVTVENCAEYGAYLVSFNKATFENFVVKGATKYGIAVANAAARNVTLKNVSFENAETPLSINETGTGKVTFNFEGVNDMGKAEFYTSQYVKVVAAAQVGTKVCGSLQDAVVAANDGETVKVLADVNMTTANFVTQVDGYATLVNVAGKAVTIDLNGKKVTVNAAHADLNGKAKGNMLMSVFHADPNGTLTLTDSSAEGTGTVELFANDATVYGLIVSENANDKTNPGKIIVNGGNYIADKLSDSMIFADINEVITVNGGNFHLGNVGTGANGKPWIFNTTGQNQIHINVNGGTYNANVGKQYYRYEVKLGEGLATTNNGDGTWTVVPGVATVGEELFGSIQEAIDAAQDGETVTLIADVALDTKKYTTQVDNLVVLFNVKGKAVTFDLNGKKIDVNASAANLGGKMLAGVFSADVEGDFTITDSSAEGTGAVTVTVNDAKVYSVFISENAGDKTKSGKMTVNAGNFTTVGKVANAMIFADTDKVVTINGGTFICDGVSVSENYPWLINTHDNNVKQVIVNGGTFNVDINHQYRPFEVFVPENLAVKANGNGTWTIVPAQAYVTELLGNYVNEPGNNEHKVGYATVAEAIAATNNLGKTVTILAGDYTGNLNVNKGITVQGETDAEDNNLVTFNGKLSITADGATVKNINFNNSGTAAYVGAKDVTIDGCSLVGSNGLYQSYTSGTVTFKNSYIKGGTYGIHFDGNAGGNIVIDNCTVIGWTSFAGTITNVAISGTTFAEGNYNQLRLYQNATITDCTFNEKMNIDWNSSNKTAEFTNCSVEGDKDLTEIISLANIATKGLKVTVDGELICVAAKVDNKYYLSLQAAIDAATEGQTVTIVSDLTLTEGVTVAADKSIFIALNGKTITGRPDEAKAYAVITNRGTLTIQGEGAVVTDHQLAGSTGYAVNTITNCGTLTIDGATIENKSTAQFQIGYAIDNNSTTGDAVVTVVSGKVIASGSNYYDGIRQFCNSTTVANDVIVRGGEVSTIWMQNPSDGANKNTKDVKGSVTIEGGNVGVLSLEPSANFEAAMTGGHVGEISYFQTATGRDLVQFVTGGTLGTRISEDFLAYGYQLTGDAAPYEVKWTGFRETVTIVDGEYTEFVVDRNIEVGTLTYTRQLENAKVWMALYIPFEFELTEEFLANYDVAYLNNVHAYDNWVGKKNDGVSGEDGEIDDMTVESILIKRGKLQANHPYIIRAKNDAAKSMTLVAYNETLYNTDDLKSVTCSSAYLEFTFGGTYQSVDRIDLGYVEDMTTCYAVRTSNGNWAPMSATAKLTPFRIYMTMKNKGGSAVIINEEAMNAIRIRLVGESDSDATDIKYYDFDTQDASYIYDLQGRRVLDPQKGNLYIVNGKKVIF